ALTAVAPGQDLALVVLDVPAAHGDEPAEPAPPLGHDLAPPVDQDPPVGAERLFVLLVVGAEEAYHLLVRGGARRDASQRLARDHGAGLPLYRRAARADVDPTGEPPAHALDEHRQQRAGEVAEHEEDHGDQD